MYDAPDPQQQQKQPPPPPRLLGAFYLDLYPRPGKYGHFAMTPLQAPLKPGAGANSSSGGGAGLIGAAALVGNFPEPANGRPALLPHSDVATLLHEFGHVMHALLGATELPSFAGARDMSGGGGTTAGMEGGALCR